MSDEDAPFEVEIGHELDLHAFAPRDIAEVVVAYLDECVARGFEEVRIIHGKGIGAQKRTVEGVLSKHPSVASFRPADERRGGWGATIVALRRGSKTP